MPPFYFLAHGNFASVLIETCLKVLQVKIRVNVHWDQVFVWIVSICSLLVYLGLRFWNLLSGKTSSLGQDNVSIPYSWMVLAAETLMGTLGFYLHQNFWKQDVHFSSISDRTLNKITQVRCMSVKSAVYWSL